MAIMWVKQCHKPPIWEWFTQPIYCDFGDGLLLFDHVLPTLHEHMLYIIYNIYIHIYYIYIYIYYILYNIIIYIYIYISLESSELTLYSQ